MTNGTFSIELGAMAQSISEQLEGQGIAAPANCDHLDADAWQISRLYVRGLLSEAECTKARKRLMAKVRTGVRTALGIKPPPEAVQPPPIQET